MSGGPEKKVEKRRKIIREGRTKRLKSPVKIYKNRRGKECFSGIFLSFSDCIPLLSTSLLLYGFSFGSFLSGLFFVFFV
ncbi:hypothetical protein MSLAZ_1688 [Methanosarcina lacustris Z-7289]|uniref:Uncharacterized protein n=1 Tax=Methanosarcina lacustris Z-7289 TaxID=1434111 RepID=A0A0E3S2D5_9EURY|nr:hypothetical protein MSLAZ_1688 [Methanosarcina lacustris Z-7289]